MTPGGDFGGGGSGGGRSGGSAPRFTFFEWTEATVDPMTAVTPRDGEPAPQPLSPKDPRFRQCYRAVGDFPEVKVGLKSLLTRIFTAFGAGLAPIL